MPWSVFELFITNSCDSEGNTTCKWSLKQFKLNSFSFTSIQLNYSPFVAFSSIDFTCLNVDDGQ